MRRAYFKNNWIAALMVAPQLLIIFVFFYWPTSQAIYWAFTLEQPWGGGNEWVGFENFRQLLTDSQYWDSVRVSVIYAIATTALAMGMALILALFADRQLTGYKFYRVGLIWPYAVAAPAVGLSFRFIFNPSAGLFSYINHLFPGLQSIPRSLTEACAMDGSGVLRRMWDLQLPLMAPTFFFLLVINITDSFTDSFGIVDTLTVGGPARATNLMVYKIYEDGFRGLDYSGAAAQSIILMLLVIALTFFQFRFVERRIHYS